MEFYPWVVVAHVFLVIVAFGAHGVSVFSLFRVKAETDRTRMAAVLDLSSMALLWAGITLILALVLGIVAAIMGGHFSRFWPWASIAVVVGLFAVMTPMGANPMDRLRGALGLPNRFVKKGEPLVAGSDADIALAKAGLHPELLAGIGLVGIALLVWLMQLKPF